MEQKQRYRTYYSSLNPNAKPWNPNTERGTEEERMVYITFSKGHPLSEMQLYNYFTRIYGVNCVESVYINREDPRNPPLFGKIVFNRRSIAWMVLQHQEEARYVINKRSLHCRKYMVNRDNNQV